MRYTTFSHLLLLSFTLLWLGSGGTPGSVQAAPTSNDAHFSELTVVLSKKELLLFAVLKKSVTSEMKEVLHSGIPLEFTFSTELLRTTQGAAEQLQTSSFTHSIKYNTLTEEYRVEFSENHNRNNTFSSITAAVQALESINGLAITPKNKLLPDSSYTLRIKAELFHKSLPPGIESFLPFFTWNNRETEWQSVGFSY